MADEVDRLPAVVHTKLGAHRAIWVRYLHEGSVVCLTSLLGKPPEMVAQKGGMGGGGGCLKMNMLASSWATECGAE